MMSSEKFLAISVLINDIKWIFSDGMCRYKYEGVSSIFRTGRLERELQMVQFSATRCSCIAILIASLVNFVAIIHYVAFQPAFIVVISLSTQSGNF